jgi:hypothetical protein
LYDWEPPSVCFSPPEAPEKDAFGSADPLYLTLVMLGMLIMLARRRTAGSGGRIWEEFAELNLTLFAGYWLQADNGIDGHTGNLCWKRTA